VGDAFRLAGTAGGEKDRGRRVRIDRRRCEVRGLGGYDPVELFVDPALRLPKLRIAAKLLRRKLGFRGLLDVIPLDASLVKGSHGAIPHDARDWPVLIGTGTAAEPIAATEVCERLRQVCVG
jgi:hypothetical protein